MNQLVDRFGRAHTYLRISVTDRCNLRCVYCMPHEGMVWQPKEELLTFEEIYRVARVFAALGIDKIRLTGGEPTVRQDLEVLIELLSSLPGIQTLAMTTNAILFREKAHVFRKAGLTALNISLDSLRQERFGKISQRGHEFENVMAGIEAALVAGYTPLKLNVVVMAGVNTDEILDFVDFVKDKPVNVRFIEYMPFKDNPWQASDVFTYAEMKRLIATRYSLKPIGNEITDVARDYKIEGFLGSVSFITSMSDSFCASCNRLRLTADGSLKSCLFHPAEINLRGMLRSGITDEALAEVIRQTVLLKPEAHPPMEELTAVADLPMIAIGG